MLVAREGRAAAPTRSRSAPNSRGRLPGDPGTLVRYAGASGDFNPIHWNERFAKEVGLPDVIGHGMFTMASRSGW